MTTKRAARAAAAPTPAPVVDAAPPDPAPVVDPGPVPDPAPPAGANPGRLADLLPDPKNRRTHGARNTGMMVDALRRVGAARSIVIDEHGEILAGNGIVSAARTVGLSKLHVVDVDG